MDRKEIPKKILEYMSKLEWPTTTEDIAKKMGVSWNTAQVHLFKLSHEGKIKFRKVGRQNQWWLIKKYEKEFGN